MTTGSGRSRSNAIGILFGRKHLHGCYATRTVLGQVRYEFACVDLHDDQLDGAVDELLSRLQVGNVPIPILAAIPTAECYFATRPIASGASNATPRALLRESLRSSAARLDEMAIDVINWQADRRPMVGIVAAPIERVEQIREVIEQTPHWLQRLEPAARSLIGVAPEYEGRERKNAVTTRVFLGEQSLLAVMSRGIRPIHWQSMPLPLGDEATGIISVARSVEAAFGACGLDNPPETVVIHGRRQLESLIDRQWLADNLPSDFRWVDTPAMTGPDMARCLVDSYLAGQDDEFDFVRQHRTPMNLGRVIPYKEICAYILAVCVLAAILWLRLKDVDAQHTALTSTAPSMVADNANPKTQRDQLSARATSVSQFLNRRVQWSEMLADISAVLPDGTRLTGVSGSAVMSVKRKKTTRTTPITLILSAECVLDDEGAIPSSINTLPDCVQEIESVAKHFDSVQLQDLRRTESQKTGVSGAQFAVVLTTTKEAR